MAIGNNFLTMEAANIFCGSSGDSNHLRLTSVHLPSIEEVYIDHRPGGAPIAIEIDVMINKLQCDFRLIGWNPNVDKLVSAWAASSNYFSVFGALRDRNTGQVHQAVAMMYGRLGQARPEAWQRGRAFTSDYSIRGIIKYTLTVANTQVFNWDFFNNTMTTAT